MLGFLKELAIANGDRLTAACAYRIRSLEQAVKAFGEAESLNDFQHDILDNLYRFDLPEWAQSILVVAVSHLAYAPVTFNQNGRAYPMFSPLATDWDRAQTYLKKALEGARMQPLPRLPLKRLGVQSGLAAYGRNNITYVEGLGSHFSYMAFALDMPLENDDWQEMRMAVPCEHCHLCQSVCPTGAIRKERFLIDNQRCLTALNETDDDFPAWLPATAHHTPYDCLKCQAVCPMNRNASNPDDPIVFDETETAWILKGAPLDDAPDILMQKVKHLGLDKMPQAVARNLRLLMDEMDKGFVPSLA